MKQLGFTRNDVKIPKRNVHSSVQNESRELVNTYPSHWAAHIYIWFQYVASYSDYKLNEFFLHSKPVTLFLRNFRNGVLILMQAQQKNIHQDKTE